MTEPRTRKHDGDVQAFIDGVADETRREDCRRMVAAMRKAHD